MIKKYLVNIKILFQEYTIKEILSAILGAFVYTNFITIVTLLAIGQIVSIYLYYLTYWVILIIIVMALLNYIFHSMIIKALKLKKPDSEVDIILISLVHQIVIDILFVIIGVLFIFVFIPLLMV